jgi:hypothetical protein
LTEDRFTRESLNSVANDTEGRKNKNVNFRVTEESEQVLVQDRVSATIRVKEDGFEVSIHKKHGNGSCKYR